jgi:K+-transporting ATPase KdpF subunit
VSVAVSGRVIWIKAIRDREGIAFQLAQLGRQHPLGRCRNQPPLLTSRRRTAKWVVRPRQCMSAASMPWKASLNLRPSNSPTPAFGSTSLALVRSTGAGCLYAVFMARPAIQRRLNAAVIILLKWPILMTWIIALLTLGLFVYLVYALIKPEKF